MLTAIIVPTVLYPGDGKQLDISWHNPALLAALVAAGVSYFGKNLFATIGAGSSPSCRSAGCCRSEAPHLFRLRGDQGAVRVPRITFTGFVGLKCIKPLTANALSPRQWSDRFCVR